MANERHTEFEQSESIEVKVREYKKTIWDSYIEYASLRCALRLTVNS